MSWQWDQLPGRGGGSPDAPSSGDTEGVGATGKPGNWAKVAWGIGRGVPLGRQVPGLPLASFVFWGTGVRPGEPRVPLVEQMGWGLGAIGGLEGQWRGEGGGKGGGGEGGKEGKPRQELPPRSMRSLPTARIDSHAPPRGHVCFHLFLLGRLYPGYKAASVLFPVEEARCPGGACESIRDRKSVV